MDNFWRLIHICTALLALSGQLFCQGTTNDCPVAPKKMNGKVVLVDCHGNTSPPILSDTDPGKSPVSNTATDSGEVSVPADSETAKAYYAFLTEHYKFDISQYEHTKAVFAWQHTSSIIIFWVSILLVLAGLSLAALQFKGTNTQTSIKISLQQLEINSSVIGLLILFISFGFFFLYLRYVYPIQLLQGPK
jgi:hypothetical protein